MANQKFGTAMPTCVPAMIAASVARPRRAAAISPTGTATITAKASARRARGSETVSRAATRSATGIL